MTWLSDWQRMPLETEPETPSLYWLALTDEQLSDLRDLLEHDIAYYGDENGTGSIYAKILRLCGETLN